MQVVCSNIGDAKKDTNYWFSLVFVLLPNALPVEHFGQISFQTDQNNTGAYSSSLILTTNSEGFKPVFLTDSKLDATHTYNDYLGSFVSAVTAPVSYSSDDALHYNNVVHAYGTGPLIEGSYGPGGSFGTDMTNLYLIKSQGVPADTQNAMRLIFLMSVSHFQLCRGPLKGCDNSNNLIGNLGTSLGAG